MARFTADTHLLRELGELLVGRDSTALVEARRTLAEVESSTALELRFPA